jgi:uncharacterized protein (TIGR03086 family)
VIHRTGQTESMMTTERMDMSEIALTGWEILDAARAMLRAAAAGVPAGAWLRPTPCTEWSAAQVLQHAALDQRVWGAALAGTPLPADNPFAPSGQFGTEPVTYADRALAESAPPWASLGQQAGPVLTPLPQGEMEPARAAGAAALDAAIHAWDIAVATGQGSPLTDELARSLRPVAEDIVEPLRGFGAYARPVDPETLGRPAGDAAALLCYLGRRPDWAP